MRIMICGGPRVGKTTLGRKLADQHNVPLISTDDFIGLKWAEVPDVVLEILAPEEGFILEGVQAARVIRRMLRNSSEKPEIDRVYLLSKPKVSLTVSQEAMGKGVSKIFDECRRALVHYGIPIHSDASEN